ncbi:heavy-metal-associated domain-containing protein [Hymenobacter busanensis]|uniref:Heavy-metal-associated domain-containing protein n=1 Tax=Hymenobacter busanensis TaxID=2607656 RepID=A0A7L4ZW97_9BACT|nr:heavy metal-associated domain-containing protein [Hymenobacter busanensis]KAA9339102.1 heavy-metal-associated domain-containing protein [Hymenobacter busanensis]QHJ07136.1 MerP protein [Hymenobacter busanensis]
MKIFRTLLFSLSLLFVASFAQAQTGKTKPKAGTEQVQIKTSAVCDMCKARLEKAMAYEKGVQAAVLDVPTQVLTVQYRADKTSPDALRAAVAATGYDADKLTANDKAYDRLPECCKKTNAVHTGE